MKEVTEVNGVEFSDEDFGRLVLLAAHLSDEAVAHFTGKLSPHEQKEYRGTVAKTRLVRAGL